MANNPISMSKVRQILKLYTQGIGKRKIALRLGMSKNTVKDYLDLYLKLKTPWQELSHLSDYELDKVFHPPYETVLDPRVKQLYDFFPEMERQLRRRGMTAALLYRKFREEHPDCFKDTTFYRYYGMWKKRVNPSLHIEHKAGDKVYIDYAGATLPYVDKDTGEVKAAQVFVAVMGWSQYAYVEATPSQAVEEFIHATENALHFFQGVPLGIVPDNLKSAVIKASRYEPLLNENFKAFADHYGTSELPTRARKPKDKALVENMVKLAYQNIYARLPDRQVLTLEELNQAIRKLLQAFNSALLTGKDCSREQQWLMEKNLLQKLPPDRYEMRTVKQATVMKNGHVYLVEDQHYYSVPYELIGKKLVLQYSRSIVDIYYKYQLVAQHRRVRSRHSYTTETTHMAPQHQFLTEWNPAFFMAKAREIDPSVEYYISQVLAKKAHPEQAYKACQGILSFASRVGRDRLIRACGRAHEIGYYNYPIIEDILKKNLDAIEDDALPERMPIHENIRGGNYYQ
jgi:transposase